MSVINHTIENEKHLVITINRPDKKNALNADVISGIQHVLDQFEKNTSVKTITIQSVGDIFCSGADLEMLQKISKNSPLENLEDSTRMAKLFKTIYTYPKPVIAKVQGHAIAGGCGLSTVCDFVVAVPDAQFSYTEVKIGFIPAIVSWFLIRKVGEGHARKLLLTGSPVKAEDAERIGLITHVVPAEKLDGFVHDFREKLSTTTSSSSLALTKSLINQVSEASIDEGLKLASTLNAFTRSTDDCKEGISAFIEKRKPNF